MEIKYQRGKHTLSMSHLPVNIMQQFQVISRQGIDLVTKECSIAQKQG